MSEADFPLLVSGSLYFQEDLIELLTGQDELKSSLAHSKKPPVRLTQVAFATHIKRQSSLNRLQFAYSAPFSLLTLYLKPHIQELLHHPNVGQQVLGDLTGGES